jgi:hypothetical protein
VSWINLPDGLTILCVAPTVLPESGGPVRDRPFALAGAVTVTLAMAPLVYAIAEPPSPLHTTVPLVAELMPAALFVRIKIRSAAPLVPFRALHSRVLISGTCPAAGDPVRRTPGGRRGDDPAHRRCSPGCRTAARPR